MLLCLATGTTNGSGTALLGPSRGPPIYHPSHLFGLQLHVAAEAPNSQGYLTTNPSTYSSIDACILSEVPHDPPIHRPGLRLAQANDEYSKLVGYTCVVLQFKRSYHALVAMSANYRSPLPALRELLLFATRGRLDTANNDYEGTYAKLDGMRVDS